MLKTLSLILIPILLVLVLNSFYNQEREALAHEYETMCETIIPIGHAIDETQETAKQIIDNLEIILKESEKQINQAERMINFANQCDRNKCSTGCHKYTYRCNPYPCNCREVCEIDPETGKEVCREVCDTCWKTCYACDVRPCTGDACDFSGIASAQDQIKESYDKINESQENIKNTIEKAFRKKSIVNEPPTLTELLTASRAGLKYCAGFVRIAEGMTPEEIERLREERRIAILLKCASAKIVHPGLKCHPNDFFCCR